MNVLDLMKEAAKHENKAMRRRLGREENWDIEKREQDPKIANRRKMVAQMRDAGMKLPEIAAQLGITLSTAKTDSSKMRRSA